jgi:hypothetical protein
LQLTRTTKLAWRFPEYSEYTERERNLPGGPLCFGQVIVEIKAVSSLTDEHRA